MGPKPTTQGPPMKNQCGPEYFRTVRNAGNRCATAPGEKPRRGRQPEKRFGGTSEKLYKQLAEDVVTRLHPRPASPGDGAHGDPLLRWE